MFSRKLPLAIFAGMSMALLSSQAIAAGPKPVKPLQGYKCLAIDAPDSVMMDFNHPIPLRSAPSDNASVIAPASAIIAVNDPEVVDHGYVKSMNFAFKTGWVPTKWLKDYTSVHPGNTCTPYVMNDGKLGFIFGH
ncbi:hypothetical protein [Acetobacter cibinongensis]|uniref:SH3b domain-containing protein n=1 Tax=Acetobacter cibinongensis TaxID=146475 RepID=A0A1Z5YV60_9PROT|nr:hypothetical protein [Acetobacter cibinongensis]OUJ02689.1 hypothetical protein HK14_05180 [Acetobacter cibinongensis]